MEPYFTFHLELEKLNKKILSMSAMVEDRVKRAVNTIQTFDEQEIQALILSDYEIDDMEVEIEEDCLKILALHQPVAGDLRFIITVIKINNEIERIGDIAVNIAMRIKTISKQQSITKPFTAHFESMSHNVLNMLRTCLDALVKRDTTLARSVFITDDKVDELRNRVYVITRDELSKATQYSDVLINIYLLARHLERIADRATNIAEEVIYLVEGTIVRCP